MVKNTVLQILALKMNYKKERSQLQLQHQTRLQVKVSKMHFGLQAKPKSMLLRSQGSEVATTYWDLLSNG